MCFSFVQKCIWKRHFRYSITCYPKLWVFEIFFSCILTWWITKWCNWILRFGVFVHELKKIHSVFLSHRERLFSQYFHMNDMRKIAYVNAENVLTWNGYISVEFWLHHHFCMVKITRWKKNIHFWVTCCIVKVLFSRIKKCNVFLFFSSLHHRFHLLKYTKKKKKRVCRKVRSCQNNNIII